MIRRDNYLVVSCDIMVRMITEIQRKVISIMNHSDIYDQAITVMNEIRNQLDPGMGNLLVIGCSTSTILGSMPGTDSNEDVADELYRAVIHVFGDSYDIAVQCCEHLNRALVVDKSVADKYQFPIVNAVPQKKAGGAFATKHFASLPSPVVVEDIASRAAAGIDIGGVMVGMHIKPVVVPLKLENRFIGKAIVIAGRSRLKYIGGERTHYLPPFKK